MNWYLIVKFFHITAVAITIGGMFARQLVRAHAKKSDDVQVIASLTWVAVRIDRLMVIPWSNIMIVMGIILALMLKWPIVGFLQGASQNWLLVSNILLVIIMILKPLCLFHTTRNWNPYCNLRLQQGMLPRNYPPRLMINGIKSHITSRRLRSSSLQP
jgi:uncharacterized membrane protein